jgi:hypothetical protein
MGMDTIPTHDNTAENAGVPIGTWYGIHEEEAMTAEDQEHGSGTCATSEDTVALEETHGDSDTTSYDPGDLELERRNSLVHELARRFTTRHSHGHITGNPFFADKHSPLNPHSKNFNARSWAKSIVDIFAEEGSSFRQSGVCFQNLNVYGFGEATDYQKDVFNIWLGVGGIVSRLMGSERRRIDILRSFDGVVRNGEMLVVLGPPGSGCSTLLKAIAGETNGLFVDKDSYFNYQGKSPYELVVNQMHRIMADMPGS